MPKDVSPPAGALSVEGVRKRYGATVAVDDVTLQFQPGTVHALVGENGAGKSTLGKILAGVIPPDSGGMTLSGQPLRFASPADALRSGIAMVAQELVLAPNLTVQQNVLLGVESRRLGIVDRKATRQRFDALLDHVGLNVRGDVTVGSLPTGDQQKVEILRAIARRAAIIVMDEPTAALDARDVAHFHALVRDLATDGCTVILISHFLGEVLALADRITVMRDGRVVHTVDASTESERSLVEAMLGRSLSSALSTERGSHDEAPAMLEVHGLTNEHLHDISLTVRTGEIVGVAGLAGSGRSELVRALAGADRISTGSIRVASDPVDMTRPSDAIRAGILTIHESRKEQGLFLGRTLVENTSILSLPSVAKHGWIRRQAERSRAEGHLQGMGVKYADSGQPVADLSGGNQQKVLFSRSLMHGLRILIADEPTRGVDIGAKAAIYDTVRDLADGGAAILFVSSEIEEVLGLSDRVLVMRKGRIVAQLDRGEADERTILAAAFDTEHHHGAA